MNSIAHASTLPPPALHAVPNIPELGTPLWLRAENAESMLQSTLLELARVREQLEYSRLALATAQTAERRECITLCVAESSRFKAEGAHQVAFGVDAAIKVLRGQ